MTYPLPGIETTVTVAELRKNELALVHRSPRRKNKCPQATVTDLLFHDTDTDTDTGAVANYRAAPRRRSAVRLALN
jgi:hypothetical protein